MGSFFIQTQSTLGWCGCAIGRETNLRFTGRGFESWLGTTA